MAFFNDDDFTPPEAPASQRPTTPPWLEPPADELPVRLPDARVLYRRDSLAILLKGIEVYREGAQIDRRSEVAAWLWPLPSPGELELFYAWPELAIPEGSVRLDADAIAAAAERAQPIWPPARGLEANA